MEESISGKDGNSFEVNTLDRSWYPSVCALEKRCYSRPWSPALILAEFGKEISFRAGIFRGDKLLAYSFNHIVEDELHVLNLAVDPAFRRKGLGCTLLAFVFEKASARGVSFFTLEVRRGNTSARELYKKFGFNVACVRKGYYRDNGEDAFVLVRAAEPELPKNFKAFAQ